MKYRRIFFAMLAFAILGLTIPEPSPEVRAGYVAAFLLILMLATK